jgi:hypothetical protein
MALANCTAYKGNTSRLSPLYKKAPAIQKKAQGLNHPDVALAMLHAAQDQYSQAEPPLQAIPGNMGESFRPISSQCGNWPEKSCETL